MCFFFSNNSVRYFRFRFMKKILLSFFVIASFVAYSLSGQKKSTQASVVQSQNSSSQTSQNNIAPSDTAAPSKIIHPNGYQNGTFTGDVADAYYGPLQVKITIDNQKITDVIFLQYPNDRGRSIEINNYAMPLLKQEEIQNQNAQVDVVSGASQTSRAFQESLQSALNKAKQT